MRFGDVPLPGLEFGRAETTPPVRDRRYDASISPTPGAEERFWNRVVKAPGDGCWIFTGSVSSPDGYGRVTWRSGGASRTLSAHRFALLLAYGPDALDVIVEHRCNEPLCVRVDDGHVIASTQQANLRYAVACGRAGAHRVDLGGRTRAQRSRDVRDAVAGGWDPIAYARAAGDPLPHRSPTLF